MKHCKFMEQLKLNFVMLHLKLQVIDANVFTVKLSEACPSGLHWWVDHLDVEPAGRFGSAVMN